MSEQVFQDAELLPRREGARMVGVSRASSIRTPNCQRAGLSGLIFTIGKYRRGYYHDAALVIGQNIPPRLHMKNSIRLSVPMLWLVLAVPAAAQSQAEPALPYSPS